jgi:hypothetical protein
MNKVITMKQEMWHTDKRYKNGGYVTKHGKLSITKWIVGVIIFLVGLIFTHGLIIILVLFVIGLRLIKTRGNPHTYSVSEIMHHDVYLMFSERQNAYKIGYSSNIGARFNNLRTACPDIKIVKTFGGGRELETAFHNRFEYCNIGGEWFTLSNVDLDYLMKFGNQIV